MTKKAIPELSIDSQTLERVLITIQIGEIASYASLSAAIGRNVQTAARHKLATARRRMLRYHHRLFECVTNEGVKRLDDAGKIYTGQSHIKRSRQQARLAHAKTTAIDNYDALPNKLKTAHFLTIVQSGMINHATRESTLKKIATSIPEPKQLIPLHECLDAMRKTL